MNRMKQWILLLAATLVLGACGGGNDPAADDDDGTTDVGDAGGDTTTDTGPDTTTDSGPDVTEDTGPDATEDTSMDVVEDTSMDVVEDTSMDVVEDTTDASDATDADDAGDADDTGDAGDTDDAGDAGDAGCDDTDMDGVCDDMDLCEGSDDADDMDMDGVPDGCDACEGSDDADDMDMDMVPDGCDLCEGSSDAMDTDMDGVPDGCDECEGFDDNVDVNMNMIPDGCEMNDPRAPAAAGELVITEFAKNPNIVDDDLGEWFEVWNATADPLDLDGLIISDRDSDSHTVSAPMGEAIVPPGGYFVFGINADDMTNGGVFVDYEYTGITLANGTDELVLTINATEIDAVEYSDAEFPDTPGSSAQFDGDADPSMDDNNDGAFWCSANMPVDPMNMASDFGTPGLPNTSCTLPATDVTIQQVQNDMAMGHPMPGTRVRIVDAIVTAASADGSIVFVQAAGGGEHSGLYLEDGDTVVAIGDVVEFTGIYTETFSGNLATVTVDAITVTGTATVPAPEVLPTSTFMSATTTEPWESALVQVESVTVTNANPDDPSDFNEFEIDSAVRVDDLFFEIMPDPALDDTFDVIVGVLNFSFGNFKIEPRDSNDVTASSSSSTVDVSYGFTTNPTTVMITAGDTVRWTNADAATHTVTSGNPGDGNAGSLFDATLAGGEMFEHTFNDVGTFNYFCRPHQGSMNGYEVIVSAP